MTFHMVLAILLLFSIETEESMYTAANMGLRWKSSPQWPNGWHPSAMLRRACLESSGPWPAEVSDEEKELRPDQTRAWSKGAFCWGELYSHCHRL